MPLYNPSSGSGGGSGIGAVTLVHPDGTSQVFTPLADGILERGTALNAAIVAAVANDLIILGPGVFAAVTPFILKSDVTLKGQGKFVTELSSAAEDTIAARFATAAAQTRLADMSVLGLNLTSGSLFAQGVRFNASGIPGNSAVFFDNATGFGADDCEFLSSVESLTSNLPGFVAHVRNCVANIAVHPNVGLLPESGLILDAAFS